MHLTFLHGAIFHSFHKINKSAKRFVAITVGVGTAAKVQIAE